MPPLRQRIARFRDVVHEKIGTILCLVLICTAWLGYAVAIAITNAFSVPIWTAGGLLLVWGLIIIGVIFGILTLVLLIVAFD